ncbi:PostSET [Seminavis robusta]|uniref:PostSET n=1 Tax=Seminavis robusta TaxID=568900 RepID=A0A9N8DI64_9STRA|nr:PostSET [Seminavis robusta]|eukprot:Sro156_g070770.1 PostSET (474) ;mRNA; r:39547-40968
MPTAAANPEGPENTNPNYVLCPVSTYDYRIEFVDDCNGVGLVANRDIAKGEGVFSESLEFSFRDVRDGDWLLLAKNYEEDEEIERTKALPLCLPVNPKVLLETHGVPMLFREADSLIERWHLESPGMLMNHSCEPTCHPSSFDWINGEGIATRDIKKGEQLTCDYTLFDYDEDGLTFQCNCGAKKCRGKRIGFFKLTDSEKEEYLPFCSDVVKARHQHALGLGPPVVRQDQPPPHRGKTNNNTIPRLVAPGPSSASADICIRPCKPSIQDDNVDYGLFAAKDFPAGKRVYYFWSQPWPTFPGQEKNDTTIDMVSSLNIIDNDASEGTVIQIDPHKCASRDAETGLHHFTGFDLLTHHSCQPNIVYKYTEEEDGDNWRGAYACRDIQKGDQLFVDFNAHCWERVANEEEESATLCLCGTSACRGQVSGFRHLLPAEQQELQALTWKRRRADLENEESGATEALSPFVRSQLRKE